MYISPKQWEDFDQQGYVRLGQIATNKQLADMQQRIDDIMLGVAPIDYEQIMMQKDFIDNVEFLKEGETVEVLFHADKGLPL